MSPFGNVGNFAELLFGHRCWIICADFLVVDAVFRGFAKCWYHFMAVYQGHFLE
jgi:hypothetical protein